MDTPHMPPAFRGRVGAASFLLILFFTLLVAGCASVETVKEAKGQGVSRIYPYVYADVFNATLAAAKDKKLDIVETDMPGGRLLTCAPNSAVKR